jgi:lambda family phage portal protein
MFTEALAWVSPKAAAKRAAWKATYDNLKDLEGERAYGLAERGRLNADWRATSGSADAEIGDDLPIMRARCGQMIRDNSYAETALTNLVAWLIGDGIAGRAIHADPNVAKVAQDVWEEHCKKQLDGDQDHYAAQALGGRSMIERGEVLRVWSALDGEPDGFYQILEGDHLANINRRLDNGGKIVGGVERDKRGRKVAYWIYPEHPGSALAGLSVKAERVDARDVDHMYWMKRPGQSRGVPWFHAGLRKLRDVSEIEAAVRVKKRIEACFALFRRKADGVFKALGIQKPDAKPGPLQESIRPGSIIYGEDGEEAPTVINPSSSGDGDGFLKGQLKAIAASFGLPAHIMTGDVSEANYSSLRAAIVVFYKLLDFWHAHVIVPRWLEPEFRRVMWKAALKLRMPALATVTATFTPPPRPWVDPLKDITAQVLEARAIPGALLELLNARGETLETAVAKAKQIMDAFDKAGVASDADPRRVNGSGGLQPATGYLAPKEAA